MSYKKETIDDVQDEINRIESLIENKMDYASRHNHTLEGKESFKEIEDLRERLIELTVKRAKMLELKKNKT